MNNFVILLISAVVVSANGAAIVGLGQYHSQNEIHDYSYGYYGGPSAKHESKIHNVTRGEYSYVDPNGLLQTVRYISDEHGFQVQATNLPTLGHPLPPAPVKPAPTTPAPTTPAPAPAPVPVPAYYPAPPPVVVAAPLPVYAYPIYPAPHPVPALAPKRVRRGIYPSYAPVKSLKHSSIALDSAYYPLSYGPKAYAPAAPAYEPAYAYYRSHIPIEEVTYDHPEPKGPSPPAPKLFVPVLAKTVSPLSDSPSPTPAPPAPVVPAPAPAYSYPAHPAPAAYPYSPSPAPAPSPTPAPPSPTPYVHITPVPVAAPAPTPAPIAEVYIKPLAKHAPASEYKYYERVPAHEEHYIPHLVNTVKEIVAHVAHAPAPAVPAPIVKAAPVPAPVPAIIKTPVKSQYHSQDELGQYAYGYSNEDSAKHETKTFDGITRGQYSYRDANGHIQSVHYISDDHHGFRVAATNLPKGPVPAPHPVPAAH